MKGEGGGVAMQLVRGEAKGVEWEGTAAGERVAGGDGREDSFFRQWVTRCCCHSNNH